MVVWEYGVLRCWHLLHIWLQLHPHSCSSNPTAFVYEDIMDRPTQQNSLSSVSEQALRALSTATVRAIGTVCIVCIVD